MFLAKICPPLPQHIIGQDLSINIPFSVDPAFLLYAERTTIQYVDLTNNNHSTQIKGLRGAVAVAYDVKDKYIYWADIKDHIIYRRGFEDDGKNF